MAENEPNLKRILAYRIRQIEDMLKRPDIFTNQQVRLVLNNNLLTFRNQIRDQALKQWFEQELYILMEEIKEFEERNSQEMRQQIEQWVETIEDMVALPRTECSPGEIRKQYTAFNTFLDNNMDQIRSLGLEAWVEAERYILEDLVEGIASPDTEYYKQEIEQMVESLEDMTSRPDRFTVTEMRDEQKLLEDWIRDRSDGIQAAGLMAWAEEECHSLDELISDLEVADVLSNNSGTVQPQEHDFFSDSDSGSDSQSEEDTIVRSDGSKESDNVIDENVFRDVQIEVLPPRWPWSDAGKRLRQPDSYWGQEWSSSEDSDSDS